LVISESCWSPDHPDIAGDLSLLGQILKALGRLSEAEPLMRRALSILQDRFPDNHPSVALGLNNVGSLLHSMNHLVEAESVMRKAVVTMLCANNDASSTHPETHLLLRNYSAVLDSSKGEDAVWPSLISLGSQAGIDEGLFRAILAQAFGELG
jgi:hypothetical protein